jgi:hypothetical protein
LCWNGRVIDAAQDSAPAGRPGIAWVLFSAGVLMLVSAFLRANPWVGAGRSLWPWELMLESTNRLVTVNWSLWLLGGALALVWGWRGGTRRGAPVLATLALVLLFTCHAGTAGLQVRFQGLPWLSGTVMLMAGLLMGARAQATSTSRLLAGLGALMVVWALAASFKYAPEGVTRSDLHQLLRDIASRVTEGTVEQFDLHRDDALWAYGSVLVGCLLGLLHALGVRSLLVAGFGVVAVLLSFMIPAFSGLGRALAVPGGGAAIASLLSEAFIDAGMGLAWFATAATLTLLPAPEATS